MLFVLGNPVYGPHSLRLSFPTKYFWLYIQKETGGDNGGGGGRKAVVMVDIGCHEQAAGQNSLDERRV